MIHKTIKIANIGSIFNFTINQMLVKKLNKIAEAMVGITKFFLDPEFAKDGELKPAKYKDVIAEAFKKSRLVIFMILRTPDG